MKRFIAPEIEIIELNKDDSTVTLDLLASSAVLSRNPTEAEEDLF